MIRSSSRDSRALKAPAESDLADEAQRVEDEPRHDQQDEHDRGEDADVAEVALDVVILGALAIGQAGAPPANARAADGATPPEPMPCAAPRVTPRPLVEPGLLDGRRRSRDGRWRRGPLGAALAGATGGGLASGASGHRYLGGWDRNGKPRSGGRPRGGYDTADFMADLNAWLLDNLALAFGVLAALVVLLLIGFFVQSARLGRAVRDYRELVRGTDGATLHDRLVGSAEQAVKASERMGKIEAMHGVIEERTRRSLQHIGLVRFNPFDDTGSDQSFVIALLDDARDGVVISSLHGRVEHAGLRQAGAGRRVAARAVGRGDAGDPDRARGRCDRVTIGAIDPEQRRVAERLVLAALRTLPQGAAAVGGPARGLAGRARARGRRSQATASAPRFRAVDAGGCRASARDRRDGR